MSSLENLKIISQNINILFVDDDIAFLNETSELLESIFKSVVTAKDGIEALDKYNHSIDLIITDLTMPNMNGIELIKEIKKINCQQAIIVLSAYNDAESLFSILESGACGFILKPIQEQQMFNILYNISKQINFKQIYEQHLLEQTKLADMGAMIDIIAHQWLNPLSIMKMRTELLETSNKEETVSKQHIETFTKDQSKNILHLEETLNEFRDFLQPKDSTENLQLQSIINSVLLLLKDFVKANHIELILECDESIFVRLHKNEFKHVLITLITNAIEAFESQNIKSKKIYIKTVKKENIYISVEDNAGGIKDELIDLIFNKNFTTKAKGTGIGLHLAKKILDKIDSKLDVTNKNNGASFQITIPQ